MNLADLNPQFWMSESNPGRGDFAFDCPRCGAPYRVMIPVHFNGPPIAPYRWGITMPWLPGNFTTWDEVTITPSVDNKLHGNRPCGAHFVIRNGKIEIC